MRPTHLVDQTRRRGANTTFTLWFKVNTNVDVVVIVMFEVSVVNGSPYGIFIQPLRSLKNLVSEKYKQFPSVLPAYCSALQHWE